MSRGVGGVGGLSLEASYAKSDGKSSLGKCGVMRIEHIPLGPCGVNCYLLSSAGQAAVVDPADGAEGLADRLAEAGLTLTRILCTHLHRDHIGGAAALAQATGAPIQASPLDAPLLDQAVGRGGDGDLPPLAAFHFWSLTPGRTTVIGETCLILATPGHSPGSLSFFFPRVGVLFTGDLLFRGNVGRGDFPGGDEATLFASVRQRVFILPEDTIIYPGHGKFTTVGLEKEFNPFFQERSRDQDRS